MQKKQTLFDYVYQNLREQIVTGRLSCGAKLPSMSSLCEFYHVGIRTVKDVLRTLKEEGYIHTEERKPAVVIYRQSEQENALSAIRSILQRRTSIREVYRTLEIVVPPLVSFSVQFCDAEDRRQLARQLVRLQKKSPDERGQICTNHLYMLLERPHNLLFRDLFASLELYSGISFFRNQARFVDLVAENNVFHHTAWVMESLGSGEEPEIISRFSLMFQSANDAIDIFLDELIQQYGEMLELTEKPYVWGSNRGRDQYYMQITRDLIEKIGTGVYPEGSFLPSESSLARQYGVCVSTVRSALAMLNDLGFGQTLNARGTRAILQSDDATSRCMRHKSYRRETLLYLSGVQLMAILLKPAARMAFDGIDAVQRKRLQEDVMLSSHIPLAPIIQCVIDHQPLQPMREILRELNELLNWGYYFSFFKDGPSSAGLLTQKSQAAMNHLQSGDVENFARELSDCYCHILEFVRDFMVECGLLEAASLVTPDCRWY